MLEVEFILAMFTQETKMLVMVKADNGKIIRFLSNEHN